MTQWVRMADGNHTVRERGQFGAKIKVDKDELTLCTHKSGRKPDAPTEEGEVGVNLGMLWLRNGRVVGLGNPKSALPA